MTSDEFSLYVALDADVYCTTLLRMDTVCAYLEMAGCDSYERLYGLIDQVRDIATKRSPQKTMTDFFARY